MNHDIAIEWATRLESGEYEQGTGALCRDGKYCCLGVLMVMAEEAGVVTRAQVDLSKEPWRKGKVFWWDEDGFLAGDILTQPVAYWAGLSDCAPAIANRSLPASNDNGVSFKTIAGWIRTSVSVP